MSNSITPSNYGLLPYGKVSYVAYLSFQAPVTTISTPLVLETLVSALIPANVKVYFSVNE